MRVADKSVQLITNLNERASSLESSNLLAVIDEVDDVLRRVNSRVTTWSQYNLVQAYWNAGKIENGLQQCETDMQTVMDKFQLDAHILLYQNQNEMRGSMDRNHDELKELMYKILQDNRELLRVVEMEKAGEHVAEALMEAGQTQLRAIREQRVTGAGRIDDDETYKQYQKGLIALHRLTGIPPTVKYLDGEVVKQNDLPVEKGPHSQIWTGYWLMETKVALKALRGFTVSEKARNRFTREIKVWARLNHPHILPFYGIVTNLGPQLHTVSPWQDNGNILEYIQNHPNVDKMVLLLGAAEGLEYLHQQGVIHGNVRCANILVTAEGKACICDFGMSKVIEDITDVPASATLTKAGSARWLSPELIENTVSSPTCATDVYSFAMAMLECFTLKPPFADLKRDAHVIAAILIQNRNPHRPNTPLPTDDTWKLMLQCWHRDPRNRPSMAIVVTRIRGCTSDCSWVVR
ncbi:hypothetical protein AcV5_005833 [Taiwanofungus camphoratus]|nr:hypothetical protein AcV5_005833 [Antrodia cinnamomea]